MWGQSTEENLRRSAAGILPDTLHHKDEAQQPPAEVQNEGGSGEPSKVPPSPEVDGIWGERDMGGPVSQKAAMQDFEELQHELTTKLTNTKSNAAASQKSTKGGYFRRMTSRASGKSKKTAADGGQPDVEAGAEDSDADSVDSGTTDEDGFHLEQFMREGHLEKRSRVG